MKALIFPAIILTFAIILFFRNHCSKPHRMLRILKKILTQKIKPFTIVSKETQYLPECNIAFETGNGTFTNSLQFHFKSRYSCTIFEIYKSIQNFFRRHHSCTTEGFTQLSKNEAFFRIKPRMFPSNRDFRTYRVTIERNPVEKTYSRYSLITVTVSCRD